MAQSLKSYADNLKFVKTASDFIILENAITGQRATLGEVLLPYNLQRTTEPLNAILERIATHLTEGVLQVA